MLDPLFAIGSILLPTLVDANSTADRVLAFGIACSTFVIRMIYRGPSCEAVANDMRQIARHDRMVNNKAGIKLPTYKPPSDVASAFRNAIAFLVSAMTDVISVCMDKKKMGKWFEALTEFKGYLDSSGVGSELEEAIYKPLVRGRLLDNAKILNDIQEEMYADRCRTISTYSAEEIQDPIQKGKRYVRLVRTLSCESA